jgi:hypothetical protein
VAGVAVGGLTAAEARAKIVEEVARPYYETVVLRYQDQAVSLTPRTDLGLEIPVDELVQEAVAASHQGEYWDGFRQWVLGKAATSNVEIPLRLTFDESAAGRYVARVAEVYDVAVSEPMVDVENHAFIPGRQGRALDRERATAMINEWVRDPEQREIALPVAVMAPDQSPARIEAMLTTLVPVMERAPTPPSFFTATIPLSTTGGLANTPWVTYTGELTWTFPYLAGYTGSLTSTQGFFFDPGKPGYRFDLKKATAQVEAELAAGITEAITFEPDLVPPPPITPAVLIPPLEARLAQFSGVTSILVKNLDTGEMVYESNSDALLSGMSISKIGIMVEVYRYLGGAVDEQTHQELRDMLGSESCNPCANRLMATVGGGSASAGAEKVSATMHRLGLQSFYLCAPFRIVERWDGEGDLVWTSAAAPAVNRFWFVQSETPRYDRCVRATPRDMARLVEMIYQCTLDEGPLREIYPAITPASCREMIDIMAANDLRNMLGAGIPAEVELAHKHGFSGYGVPWGDTRGEVGIVFSPGATWLVSFYIWEDTPWIDWGINQPLYRDVSNMLYNYFNVDRPYWPPPQWTPPPETDVSVGGA